jgi:hypothetical protein
MLFVKAAATVVPGGCSTTTNAQNRGREEKILTLNSGSVYHVRNNTCIHSRANDPNIYIYRRGEYTKNPLEKYNNIKG